MSCQFDRRTSELCQNLEALYARRTSTDTDAGVDWYPEAHALICHWSEQFGFSISTVACMVAALSPQLEWRRNLATANALLLGQALTVGVLHANLRKAQRILVDRATDTRPYFPHGPKVYTFARNLAGDYSLATVDTHAAQAALNDVQSNYRLCWTPYGVFSACYARVAYAHGLEAASFQAIIWHIWKRLYPRTVKLQARRQWHVVGDY